MKERKYAYVNAWANKTEEEKLSWRKKLSEAQKRRWSEATPEQIAEWKRVFSEKRHHWWDNLPPEEEIAFRELRSKGDRKYWKKIGKKGRKQRGERIYASRRTKVKTWKGKPNPLYKGEETL